VRRLALGELQLELPVNCDEWIKAAISAVVVADEAVFRADLDVAAVAVAINQHCAERGRVGIADRQSSEAVIADQFLAGFSGIRGPGIGIDHAGRDQGLCAVDRSSARVAARASRGSRRGSIFANGCTIGRSQ